MHIIVTYFALFLGLSYVNLAYGEYMGNYDYSGYSENGNLGKNLYRGYPVGISCSDKLLEEDDGGSSTGEMVQCTISKNDLVIFNETATTSQLQEKGIFEEADETWDHAQVVVTLISTNSSIESVSMTYILNEPISYNCSSHPMPHKLGATAETSLTVPCGHPYYDLYLTPKESSNYTFWWYHGCQRIERNDRNYEYVDDYFKPGGIEGTRFANLKILNVSFSTSPGEYSCVLEKNEVDGTGSKTIMHLSTRRLCVTRKRYLNEPHVAISEKVYRVEPGSDLQMIAHGHTGTKVKSQSQRVGWNRIGDNNLGPDLCLSYLASQQHYNPDCTSYIHTIEEYCDPTNESETLKQPLDDYFNSSYWIRNATKDQHQGTYQVTFYSTKGDVNDTYKVIVEKRAQKPYGLMNGLIAVGVLLVTVLIIVALLCKNRTDARYFHKKIFKRYCHTSRPMAFLIYSSDVKHEMGNALDIANNFFGGRRFYDTNNIAEEVEKNPLGLPRYDHASDMMKQCLRLMIFLTPNLLEENDDENFQIYQGFEDSIQQSLQVIFICTREMKKKIFANEFGNATAIKNFMTKQKNFVITWDENNTAKFRRALYVALPKVPDRPVQHQTTEKISISIEGTQNDDDKTPDIVIKC